MNYRDLSKSSCVTNFLNIFNVSMKTLTESEIILLKTNLDILMEKYEIDAPNFYELLNRDISELEYYDFNSETIDIGMNDEYDTLHYSVEDMLRYLPNIEKLAYDDKSAWCNNVKQIIIDIDEWEAERINIIKYSFKGDFCNIKFVKNPFYIGVAAVEQGIADDNYGITPCSRYIAAEFEYNNDEFMSIEDEYKLLKQLLHTISVETGASLKLGQFFIVDYDFYDFDEEDNKQQNKICYGPKDLLIHTKAMDYFSKAIEIEDKEIRYLHFYKIIEYFSPIASKKNAYNMLNLRLDALGIKNRSQQYLESIFQLTRNYDESLTDKELATTVLRECVDILELFDILPESIQRHLKKDLHIQKDMTITSLKTTEIDLITKGIGQILYSTRNQIVHAKSNYRPSGRECPNEDMEQLNFFMMKLCQCLIIWNNRQPDEYRLN